MVPHCRDVGIYKNSKITEHLEINDVDILRTDETMIESYEETISVTKDNDESVKEILTQTSLLSPIDDGTYNQNDDDGYNSSKNKIMSYNDMMSVASKLHNALQRNRKHKVTECGFLLHLLDFVNNDTSIDIVPDEHIMNKSFMKLIRKYNNSFLSVDDMTLINDDITISSKPSYYHKETNNSSMSINEQRK